MDFVYVIRSDSVANWTLFLCVDDAEKLKTRTSPFVMQLISRFYIRFDCKFLNLSFLLVKKLI